MNRIVIFVIALSIGVSKVFQTTLNSAKYTDLIYTNNV